MENKITLYELNKRIQQKIKESFADNYWIIAEISDIKINRSGHCYLELIEKGKDESIIAKANATIWSYTFRMLKPYFETTTGESLSSGLKVLINVHVDFHELYGFSINIKDIDPNYTIGDLARKKQEIINQLKEEGIFNMNKEVSEKIIFQKIAIISSETAAGYEDFCNQLKSNSSNYTFYLKLFPAVMQGDQTEKSIITALDKIYLYESFFDCVVIIRGGGAQSELNAFNSYWLAYHITQFPIPVITGIGHEKDETIIDLVAHTKLKTPTAVAEFLIEKMSQFELYIEDLKDHFILKATNFISNKKNILNSLTHTIHIQVKDILAAKKSTMMSYTNKLQYSISYFIRKQNELLISKISEVKKTVAQKCQTQKNTILLKQIRLKSASKSTITINELKLKRIQDKTHLLNPEIILKRGYSITLKEGKTIKNISDLKENDEIETHLMNGKIKSKIVKK